MTDLPTKVTDAIRTTLEGVGKEVSFGGEPTGHRQFFGVGPSEANGGLPAFLAIEMGEWIAKYASHRIDPARHIRIAWIEEPHMRRLRADGPEALLCKLSIEEA